MAPTSQRSCTDWRGCRKETRNTAQFLRSCGLSHGPVPQRNIRIESAQGHRFGAGLLQPSKGKKHERRKVLSCELDVPTMMDLCLLSIVTCEGTQMDAKVTCGNGYLGLMTPSFQSIFIATLSPTWQQRDRDDTACEVPHSGLRVLTFPHL